MNQVYAVLLTLFVFCLGFVPSFLTVTWWERKLKKEIKETPLTHDMLRPPGYSLRNQIDDVNFEIQVIQGFFSILPLFLFGTHVSYLYLSNETLRIVPIALLIIVAIVVFISMAKKWLRLLKQRKNLKLGMEGEMFTGEALNQLTLDGWRVFHDVELSDKGNIDHVLIGPGGVFCVETKTRSKLKQGKGRGKALVVNDGDRIQFTDNSWVDLPRDQVEAQARELTGFLRNRASFNGTVKPMVALPGWFLESKGRRDIDGIRVINPKTPRPLFATFESTLKESEISRLSKVLDEKNRTVKRSFMDTKK